MNLKECQPVYDSVKGSYHKLKTICIFAAHFYPHLGGIERYTQNLAKQFIQKGHRVIVVTSNTDNSPWNEIIDDIVVYRLPILKFIGGRLPIPLVNKKFFKIMKLLFKKEIDYFIINARFYIHSLLGAAIARSKRRPALLIEHGTGHFTLNNRLLDFIGRMYEHSITYFLKRLVKNFYGVSSACNLWLKHFNIEAKGVFYNSIDRNYSYKRSIEYRKNFKLNQEDVIITYTGRLIPEKGILLLTEAFNRLSDIHKNIYLFVAGDGPLYPQMKKMVNNKIYMLGRIDYDEVMSLMRDTDIFVLPTNFPEGLPTSVLEAGISKCAVIATPRGGTPEVITNNELGILIDPIKLEELVDALNLLILNRERRIEISNNLYNKVFENFDWSVVSNQVLLEFEKIELPKKTIGER